MDCVLITMGKPHFPPLIFSLSWRKRFLHIHFVLISLFRLKFSETIPRLDEHLKNPEYANWIKSMEALRITLGVLKPYVHQQLPAIQRAITDKGPPGVACSSCNVSEAQNCPDNVCNFYKEEIINYHRLHTPSFCNTNACKWSTDAWEIAKCFIPPGGKYMYCTQSEADFSCIINIIIQCNHFDSLVSNQDGNIFRKVRRI